MFTRLANTRVQKGIELGVPTIKVQAANRIVFTQEAVTLLKLGEEDRIDVLKQTETGTFYIANVGPGIAGRSLSKTDSITHERISKELGGKGKAYTITDTVVEFDSLDWYKLELIAPEVKEASVSSITDSEAPVAEEVDEIGI